MYLFSRLNSSWSNYSPTAHDSKVLASQEPELVSLVKKNLTTLSVPELQFFRKELKRSNIEHPICLLIDEKINQLALSTLGFTPTRQTIKTHGLKPSEKCYVQPYAISTEETIKALERLAGKLDEIELCSPTDELLAFVAEKFPNLTCLVIQEKLRWWFWTEWNHFTDHGLESIANLKNLKRLDLICYSSLPIISYSGFNKLLSQPQFAAHLEELNIESIVIGSQCLPIIATYQQLKKLHIGQNSIFNNNINALLESPTLKNTIIDFCFYNWNPVIINDDSLKLLQNFVSLQHLSLEQCTYRESGWKVSDSVLIEFLESKKKLNTLRLAGPSINDAIAEKLNQLTELNHLFLDDCSRVSSEKGWDLLLGNKERLNHLELQKLNMNRNNTFLFDKIPLTFLSLGYVDICFKDWMENLCSGKNLQRNLKTLHLSNFLYAHSEAYKPLALLKGLTSLRFDKCVWFNHEALESLTPLAETLETLAFGDVALDDKSIEIFAKFKKLKNLFLGQAKALTQEGIDKFQNNEFLKKNIVCLETMDFYFDDKQSQLFTKFENLKILILKNALNMSDNGEKALQKWAFANKVKVFFPGTTTFDFEDFDNGVKDATSG